MVGRLAWRTQKELEQGEIPTQYELFRVAQTFEKPMEKCLFILTYLTGGRISEVIPLIRTNFEKIYFKERERLNINMINRKNRRRHKKTISIPYDKEGQFVDDILPYINSRGNRLFTFNTPRRGHQIISKIGMNPHWLRHIRLTHLVTIYGLNEQQVIRFAGWSDGRPSARYMELRWQDIAEKM